MGRLGTYAADREQPQARLGVGQAHYLTAAPSRNGTTRRTPISAEHHRTPIRRPLTSGPALEETTTARYRDRESDAARAAPPLPGALRELVPVADPAVADRRTPGSRTPTRPDPTLTTPTRSRCTFLGRRDTSGSSQASSHACSHPDSMPANEFAPRPSGSAMPSAGTPIRCGLTVGGSIGRGVFVIVPGVGACVDKSHSAVVVGNRTRWRASRRTTPRRRRARRLRPSPRRPRRRRAGQVSSVRLLSSTNMSSAAQAARLLPSGVGGSTPGGRRAPPPCRESWSSETSR